MKDELAAFKMFKALIFLLKDIDDIAIEFSLSRWIYGPMDFIWK